MCIRNRLSYPYRVRLFLKKYDTTLRMFGFYINKLFVTDIKKQTLYNNLRCKICKVEERTLKEL